MESVDKDRSRNRPGRAIAKLGARCTVVPRWSRRRPIAVVAIVLMLMVTATPAPAQEPGPDDGEGSVADPFAPIWDRELGRNVLESRDGGSVWTALARSADGGRLVAGTDIGVVAFFDTTAEGAGRVITAFQAEGRGHVTDIDLTTSGTRAALRFSTGYLAVVDEPSRSRLLEIEPPPDNGLAVVRSMIAITDDGRFVFTTGAAIAVYYTPRSNITVDEGDGIEYDLAGTIEDDTGPFLYVHPASPLFGALTHEGLLRVYAYRVDSVRLIGETPLLPPGSVRIGAVSVASGGEHVAIGFSNGTFVRYFVDRNNAEAFLQPRYQAELESHVLGIRMSPDGQRIIAWSNADVGEISLLWANGDNVATTPVESEATRASEQRMMIPGITYVATSSDLYRALVRSDAGTFVYNLPERDVAGSTKLGSGVEPATLDDDGEIAFITAGATIGAFRIDTAILPPPSARNVDVADDAGDGGFLGLGESSDFVSSAWIWGVGILALVLLPLLVAGSVVLKARARREQEQEPPFAAFHDDVRATGAWADTPGHRRVIPSSEPVAALPDVRLLFDNVVADGHGARLNGLDIRLARPGVVRIEGSTGECVLVSELLAGRTAIAGHVAVRGVSPAETPVLFARRVRSGCPTVVENDLTVDDLVARAGAEHGLPEAVLAKRRQSDLEWLPPARRAAAFAELTPLERWKVRVVLALIHRPDVLVLGAGDLPAGSYGDTIAVAAVEAVRRVLRGIARHYDVLVVLLDDGRLPEPSDARWADELVVIQGGRIAGRRYLTHGPNRGRDPQEGPTQADPANTSRPPNATHRRRRRTPGRKGAGAETKSKK